MRMADPNFVETSSRSQATDSTFIRASSLPRRLGLFSAIAVLVGSTIGSGIFRSPAGVAERIPDTKLFLAAWIAGGLCIYLREAFGRLPAFLFGWAELTIIRASALGAISTVFVEYTLRMAGISDPAMIHYGAAIAILFVAAFNSAGISIAASVQNLTAGSKY